MTEQLPFVSIVMPVRNEALFLQRSLGCVLAQDYPAERLEIIVADGCSTDATPVLVQSLQHAHPHLRLLENPGKIAPTGLNVALREARGDIIVRVDGHCEIAPDYVRRCVAHLQNDGVDGVGGPLETIGATPMAAAIAVAMSSPFGVGGSAFRTIKDKTMLTDTVAFPAYTRAIIERAGLYDEELVRNQDDEYNYRLRKLGGQLLLATDVKARYYSRSSLQRLWRQYYQYGFWKVRVWQKHPRQMHWRQFVPGLFSLALLSTLGLAVSSPFWFLLLSGLYGIANLTASIWTATQFGWQHMVFLPLIFLTLHLSYGVGFLLGLIRFAHRWRSVK